MGGDRIPSRNIAFVRHCSAFDPATRSSVECHVCASHSAHGREELVFQPGLIADEYLKVRVDGYVRLAFIIRIMLGRTATMPDQFQF